LGALEMLRRMKGEFFFTAFSFLTVPGRYEILLALVRPHDRMPLLVPQRGATRKTTPETPDCFPYAGSSIPS
jgi:hypothetical protein